MCPRRRSAGDSSSCVRIDPCQPVRGMVGRQTFGTCAEQMLAQRPSYDVLMRGRASLRRLFADLVGKHD